MDEMSDAFQIAAALRKSKKKDYGGLEGYFPFGGKSYVHEINKKSKRLVQLISTGATPNHESVEDTLIDLINYASYYWEYLNGYKGESNE